MLGAGGRVRVHVLDETLNRCCGERDDDDGDDEKKRRREEEKKRMRKQKNYGRGCGW
jgi:hypothetical protein